MDKESEATDYDGEEMISNVIRLRRDENEDTDEGEEESYSELVEFIDKVLHLADQEVLQDNLGAKIVITIEDDGWCIEAESDEDQFEDEE